jgi:hypothetical protein
MSDKRGSILPGIFLIVVGVWFLLVRFEIIENYRYRIYSVTIIILALFLLIEAFRNSNSSALFWGVTILVIGGFFSMRNFGIIPHYYFNRFWPILLIGVGSGFFSLFIFDPRDWGVLIPAFILIFFGIGLSIRSFSNLSWNWDFIIEKYWPIPLILIGMGILLKGVSKTKNIDK